MISTSTFAQLTSQLRNSTLTFREDTLSKAQIRYNGVDFFFDNNEFNGNTYVESRNDIELRTGLTPTTRLFVNEFGNIGMGTTTPNSSAILDINSMDKGILIPRVVDTTIVSSPVEGLLIYDISESNFKYYNDSRWIEFGGSDGNLEVGHLNTANGGQSSAVGYLNTANGDESVALGYRNSVPELRSSAVGYFNSTDGANSSAFGYTNYALGDRSSAIGYFNDARAVRSSAFGYTNYALGDRSSAMGYFNYATGNQSTAFGHINNASGDFSNAFGRNNDATGDFSSAFGYGTFSNVYRMTTIGVYNDIPTGSDTSWIWTDPVFIIGNGQTSGARSTALTILKNGNTGIGTTTPSDRLHIVGSSDGGSALRIATGNISNLSDTKPGMFLRRLDGKFAGAMYANVEGETADGIDMTMQAEDEFLIYTNNDLSDPKVRVEDNGNVGIGTGPAIFTFLLSVNGTAAKIGGGDWSTLSDKRLKRNIRSFEDGLAKILKIRPVRFQYNGKAGMPSDQTYIGIVAQEMQEIAPYTIHPTTIEMEQEGKKEYLSYDGTAVTYMLVNAIQEQQRMIEEKEKAIADLRTIQEKKDQKIEDLEARLSKIEALLSQNDELNFQKEQLTSAQLQQNTPNPFKGKTNIQYYIPEGTNTAMLRITNANGRVIKEIPIAATGEGQIELETSTLGVGNYFYSLLLDGQLFETKQMILSK
ncbi:MAG: tail fiber domain-containing protein [Bacteroidota bacterium]